MTGLMSREVFKRGLSVEATSAYILICTLAESGTPVTIESAGSFWNDTPEALARALEKLKRHRIIYEELDSNQMRQLLINPPDLWEKPDD
jgi:hypothetical protein